MVNHVPAFIVRHGDDTAGIVLVKVNRLDGTCIVYSPARAGDGSRIWLAAAPVAEAQADAYISKQSLMDPDLWVIEIEDPEGRHFLQEPIG